MSKSMLMASPIGKEEKSFQAFEILRSFCVSISESDIKFSV